MGSQPKVVVERSEHYRTIIVSGAFGGHGPGFIEAIIYTDEPVADEALASVTPLPDKIYVKRVIQCRLIFSPLQAKSFVQWLQYHIREYEKKFGEIKLPEEGERPGYIS